jgi:hypothetical protein
MDRNLRRYLSWVNEIFVNNGNNYKSKWSIAEKTRSEEKVGFCSSIDSFDPGRFAIQ